MAITASEVKKLREVTGVGMMDCKKALQEANGDFDAAIDLLRKKGQKVAAKRADREAKEGIVAARSSGDQSIGVLVEVNCETDFVARNDDFQGFAEKVADLALANKPTDRDAFLDQELDGRKLSDALTDMTGKIGEKIDVSRVAVLKSDSGKVVSYIHPGARLGVLVDVAGGGDLEAAGRDVAMQIAALNPIAVRREEVDQAVQEKEMEIGRETARNEGKPDHIIDRIATGKLERFFKDNVLLEQPFVKDASQSVKDMLKGADADVTSFERFALGD